MTSQALLMGRALVPTQRTNGTLCLHESAGLLQECSNKGEGKCQEQAGLGQW